LINHYWSIFVLLIGACVGSFLNVVIYRWSRDLSIRKPLWSFCPACHKSIAWYDNIPIVSYLLLRGRCRRCKAPISLHYPLVELATAAVFIIAYDAMFVAQQRIGIGELPDDAVMLITHWVLWAGLIVLAVMDLEYYMVDIRVTWFISAAAVVGHVLWVPSRAGWICPGPDQAMLTFAALIGLGMGSLLFLRRMELPPPNQESEEPIVEDKTVVQGMGDSHSEEEPAAMTVDQAQPVANSRWIWLIFPIGLVIAYLVVMFVAGQQKAMNYSWPVRGFWEEQLIERAMEIDPGFIRVGIGLAVVFVVLALCASYPHAEADSEIVEAIHSEANESRGYAFGELCLITPAILLAVGSIVLMNTFPGMREYVHSWLYWKPVGNWQPILGLSTAITGFILGGAIGWLARIIFTLVLGKEALGMGDVHILAAAGAVAGWPVALLGFFLASPLTLLAILVIRLRRQSRALPYGPWLGLGFLLASLFQDRILLYLGVRSLF